jgi:hypothetical protein
MYSQKLRKRTGWAVVLAFALCLAAVGGAVAQNADPVALANRTPVSGTLVGSRSGAFAYYTIDYPGNRHVVTIELRFMPDDPVTSLGVGFNVYAPDGFLIGQSRPNENAEKGVVELQYSDDDPATWLVQVYNYIPDSLVYHTIVAKGLPSSPGSPVSGALTGDSSGAFAFYTIDYPGDLRVVTIELDFVPADPVTCLGVGFTVYAPDGFLIGEGTRKDERYPGVLSLDYSDDDSATWLVQIYNYIPNRVVDYTLVAKGLPSAPMLPGVTQSPPTPAPESPTPTPPAPTPTPEVESEVEPVPGTELPASGTLRGSRGGAFAVYDLPYAGDGSGMTVTMSFVPDNPGISTAVGFVIYGPSGEAAIGKRTGRPAERQTTFSSDQPGSYIVQVYNYAEDLIVHYAVTAEP